MKTLKDIAPPPLTISVGQNEIDTAIPNNSGHCMIADSIKLAVTKKLGHKPTGVSVDAQTIRFSDMKTGYRYVYLTPRVAAINIVKFDQGIKPKPFKFRLPPSGQVVPCRVGEHTKRKAAANKLRRDKVAKAKLVSTNHRSQGNRNVIIGGKTPPRAILGANRQFGLRSLGKIMQTDLVTY